MELERLPKQRPLDDLLDEEELRHYSCGMFSQYWVGGDVEVITESYNQVSNVDIRRLVTKSYGFQALRELALFVETVWSGGEWEDMLSGGEISGQGTRWICCQVVVSTLLQYVS